MTRGLLPLFLLVGTLTLGYGSVFALLAEIRARFGFDDWAIGLIGGAGFAAGFVAQAFLSRFADRGHVRALLGTGILAALLGFAGMIVAHDSRSSSWRACCWGSVRVPSARRCGAWP
jgi:MFS family permease